MSLLMMIASFFLRDNASILLTRLSGFQDIVDGEFHGILVAFEDDLTCLTLFHIDDKGSLEVHGHLRRSEGTVTVTMTKMFSGSECSYTGEQLIIHLGIVVRGDQQRIHDRHGKAGFFDGLQITDTGTAAFFLVMQHGEMLQLGNPMIPLSNVMILLSAISTSPKFFV